MMLFKAMLVFLLFLSCLAQKSKDPYQTLGLTRDANQTQIKKAFRELSLKYHPDKNPQGSQQFKQILLAYETLKENHFKYSPYFKYYQNNKKYQNFDDMSDWQFFRHHYQNDFKDGYHFQVNLNQEFMRIMNSQQLKNFFKQVKYDQNGNKMLQDCFGLWCWCHNNIRVYISLFIFIASLIMIVFGCL